MESEEKTKPDSRPWFDFVLPKQNEHSCFIQSHASYSFYKSSLLSDLSGCYCVSKKLSVKHGWPLVNGGLQWSDHLMCYEGHGHLTIDLTFFWSSLFWHRIQRALCNLKLSLVAHLPTCSLFLLLQIPMNIFTCPESNVHFIPAIPSVPGWTRVWDPFDPHSKRRSSPWGSHVVGYLPMTVFLGWMTDDIT